MEATTDFSSSYKNLKRFREEQKFCDAIIHIGEKTFPCHRNILASACVYFENLFNEKKNEGKVQNIHLNCDAKAFTEILTFIYNGKIDVNSENAHRLLTTSVLFGLHYIEELCTAYLENHLSLVNIFEICALAEANNKTSLVNKLVDDIAENFSKLSEDNNINKLSNNVMECVLTHEKLHCDNRVILGGIIRWLKNSKNTVDLKLESDSVITKPNSPEFEKVKLYVATDFINKNNNCVKEFTFKNETLKCVKTLKKCLNCKTIKLNSEKYCLINTQYTTTDRVEKEKNYFYYNEGDKWKTIKPPPVLCKDYELVAGDDLIYLYVKNDVITEYSPFCRHDFLKKTENYRLFSYIPMLNEWFCIPSSQYIRPDHCIATINNILYLCGGVTENECPLASHVSSAQFYDHRESRWHKLPDMLFECPNSAAVSFKGKVFVSGPNNCMQAFDPVSGKWQRKGGLHYYASNRTFIAQGELIYCFSDLEIPFESYDYIADCWTRGPKVDEKLFDAKNITSSKIVDAIFF